MSTKCSPSIDRSPQKQKGDGAGVPKGERRRGGTLGRGHLLRTNL